MEPSAGERLKQLRLGRGITLEEVSKKTKIHVSVLKALEEGAVANFNPVYLKGFLKIYCGFLGVDPRDYLGQEKQAQPVQRALAGTSQKQGLGSWLARIDPGVAAKIARAAVFLVCAWLLFIAGKAVSAKVAFSWQRAKENRAHDVSRQKAQVAAAAPSGKTAALPQAAKPASVSSVKLTVHVKENCWLQVKSDGKVVFQRVLMKGRSETWQAKERIELAVGNAGAVELHANDRFIPTIGKKGQSLKNIVITKEGLSIGR